jgi:hypothetical protein
MRGEVKSVAATAQIIKRAALEEARSQVAVSLFDSLSKRCWFMQILERFASTKN